MSRLRRLPGGAKQPNSVVWPTGHVAGKTTSLLDIVQRELEAGVSPFKIGFFSFTKKSTQEAMERACIKFGFKPEQLPYFRTIHSLAFKQLGIKPGVMMQWTHYRDLGAKIGMDLKPKRALNDDFYGMETGDRIMFLEGLARVKQCPLEKVWRDADEVDIQYALLDRFARSLAAYKKTNTLFDFSDILEQFAASPFAAPKLDVVVIDEAQDLSLLQWNAVLHAARHAKRVYVGGDDLQAIYQWSGADVDTFLSLQGEKRVLEQSYRIPAAVHKIAAQISSRIRVKSEQVYRPRAEQGVVRRYSDPEGVDLSKDTWLLLARNGYMLRQLEDMCMRRGWSFTSTDKSPMEGPALKALLSWEQMRKGKPINKSQATNMLKFIPVERIPQEQRSKVSKLGEDVQITLATADSPPWFVALTGINVQEREYFRAARKKGETLTGTPRIRISTIHAAKGGEADQVMLLTDISQRTEYEMRRNPDSEHRVFYVGVTRARQGLHIIQPQTETSYSL